MGVFFSVLSKRWSDLKKCETAGVVSVHTEISVPKPVPGFMLTAHTASFKSVFVLDIQVSY